MLVTLEINNKDRAYDWFLTWLAKQTTAQVQQSRRFSLWARSHQLSVETTLEQRKNGSSSALFKLVAGPGTHYVQYKGAWMQVGSSLSPIGPLNRWLEDQTGTRNEIYASCIRDALGNGHFDNSF